MAKTRPPKALTSKQVEKHLRNLPGWEAVGGNRELVGHFSLRTPVVAIIAAGTVAFANEATRCDARIELWRGDLVVRLSTPAVGAVTLADIRLAEILVRGPLRLIDLDERLSVLRATAAMEEPRRPAEPTRATGERTLTHGGQEMPKKTPARKDAKPAAKRQGKAKGGEAPKAGAGRGQRAATEPLKAERIQKR